MKLWKSAVLALGVFGALTFGGTFEVNAANWYYLGESYDGDQYSIDTDSIIMVDDREANLWMRVNQPSGEHYLELVRLNRDNHTMQTLDVKPFYADGTPYSADEFYFDNSIDTIPEGSMGEELFELLWGKK